MSLLIILALGWTVGIVKANSKGYMYANAGLAGKMFTENIVFESAAKNAPHCALVCNHHDSCMSFTFNHNICRGHAVLVTSNTTSVLAAGARSFYTEGELTKEFKFRMISLGSSYEQCFFSSFFPLKPPNFIKRKEIKFKERLFLLIFVIFGRKDIVLFHINTLVTKR